MEVKKSMVRTLFQLELGGEVLVIEERGDGGHSICIKKGSEFIVIDEGGGGAYHIYASDRSGCSTVAELKFMEDYVDRVKVYG
jgi:hypothetical protein